MSSEIIQIKELSFSWAEELIFDNVCLLVDEPKIISLTGENGSGKTTFLKLLSGMVPHFARGRFVTGDILLFGKSVFSHSPKEFFPKLAFVPDSNVELFFFAENLAEEVEILQGLLNLKSENIQAKINIFANFFPQFHSLTGLNFREMDVRQRQLSLMFIYFLQNAHIFLLDEMQWEDQGQIFDFFYELNRMAKTVIFVSQNQNVSRIDEVWTISQRKVLLQQWKS